MTIIDRPTKQVAFLDLAALHAPLRAELDEVWARTVEQSTFIAGTPTEAFEQEWAAYCGTGECIGVANGTDALELVLAGLGIGAGDEVIVPANTFVATAEAVVTVGATPVFVDVDPHSLLITAEAIDAALSSRTRAVMVVHLYGQIPDMDTIGEVARTAGIHDHRGRGPGPRRDVQGSQSRQFRHRRNVQLLSGQEPGGTGRRWRGRDRRSRSRRAHPHPGQPRTGPSPAPHPQRPEQPPRWAPGRGPQREAGPPRPLERSPAQGAPSLRGAVRIDRPAHAGHHRRE